MIWGNPLFSETPIIHMFLQDSLLKWLGTNHPKFPKKKGVNSTNRPHGTMKNVHPEDDSQGAGSENGLKARKLRIAGGRTCRIHPQKRLDVPWRKIGSMVNGSVGYNNPNISHLWVGEITHLLTMYILINLIYIYIYISFISRWNWNHPFLLTMDPIFQRDIQVRLGYLGGWGGSGPRIRPRIR